MIPLYFIDQIRQLDSLAEKKLGVSGLVLMENAAANFTRLIIATAGLQKGRDRIAIICGKGNNGGDGFAAARHFVNAGFEVKVLSLFEPKDCSADCRTNYAIAESMAKEKLPLAIKLYTSKKDFKFIAECNVIIDAMLGSGFTGELKSPFVEVISYLNNADAIKIAIDIPSGLYADTGYGEIVFRADYTVTLGDLKAGLFFGNAIDYCGLVLKAGIGIDAMPTPLPPVDTFLIEAADAFNNLPVKQRSINKYSSGKLLTIAGSLEFPGAALLAAEAAFRVGTGASRLAFPKSIAQLAHQHYPDLVVELYDDDGKPYLTPKAIEQLAGSVHASRLIAFGSGIGRHPETVEAVAHFLETFPGVNAVIDADAIHAIAQKGYDSFDLRDKVFTPHLGEFSALIGVPSQEIKKDMLAYGLSFVRDTESYLVLKGPRTIIFTPYEEIFINTTGNPGMAKFGSGDVLTGVLAGMMSQSILVTEALLAGVYIHSLTGDILAEEYTEYGFVASDLVKGIPSAIKFLRNKFDPIVKE